MASTSKSKIPKVIDYSRPIRNGKIGLLEYEIYNVRGDGSCFYRAIYQILRESPKGMEELNLTEADITEDSGVKKIRDYIGNIIKNTWDADATVTIDNLCGLVNEAEEEDREQLYDDLSEMYPFVTEEVCDARGIRRYQKVASLVEDMDDMMYASSLEMDIMKRMLEAIANLSVVVISIEGKHTQKVELKWKSDLIGLLKNTTKRDVGILLNKDNIHYQYLVFKGPSDADYHTIMDRVRLLQLLEDKSDVLSKTMNSLSISGGGNMKGVFHKKKVIRKMYSVASSHTFIKSKNKNS